MGFKLLYFIAFTGEMKVNEGTIISSLGFKFNNLIAICKAEVPLTQATAYFTLIKFLIVFSKSLI